MASSHSLLKTVKSAEVVIPVKAMFDDDIDKKTLAKTLLLTNLDSKKNSGEFLKSTVSLILKNSRHFERLHVLVTGSLMRWHFWVFCELLSDVEIKKLLFDVTGYGSAEELSGVLASKFHRLAKAQEDDFIREASGLFLAYLSPKMRVTLLSWDRMLTSPQEAKEEMQAQHLWGYFANLKKAYKADPQFANVINRTCYQVTNNAQVRKQCKRLSTLIPGLKNMTTDEWLSVVNVSHCNYQLEKAAVLIPGLCDRDYSSVLTVDIFTEALRMAAQLYTNTNIPWNNISHQQLTPVKKAVTSNSSSSVMNHLLSAEGLNELYTIEDGEEAPESDNMLDDFGDVHSPALSASSSDEEPELERVEVATMSDAEFYSSQSSQSSIEDGISLSSSPASPAMNLRGGSLSIFNDSPPRLTLPDPARGSMAEESAPYRPSYVKRLSFTDDDQMPLDIPASQKSTSHRRR
jgi:hypothetical protein